MQQLNIKDNRSAKKYSTSIQMRRIVWSIVSPLFRYSPRIAFSWRNMLLKILGAKIGNNVHIYNSARIYMPWNLIVEDWAAIGENVLIYNLCNITINSKATISHGAHLCTGTHDYTLSTLPLITKPIVICENAWVCADAYISPGVTIGKGAVIAARSVVTKDITAWTIAAGNPAKPIKRRVIKE